MATACPFLLGCAPSFAGSGAEEAAVPADFPGHAAVIAADFLENYPPSPAPHPEGGMLLLYQSSGDSPRSEFYNQPAPHYTNRIYRVPANGTEASLWQHDLILSAPLHHAAHFRPEDAYFPATRLYALDDGKFIATAHEYIFWAPNPARGSFRPDKPATAALRAGAASNPSDVRLFMSFLGLYDMETPGLTELERFSVLPTEMPGGGGALSVRGQSLFYLPIRRPRNSRTL